MIGDNHYPPHGWPLLVPLLLQRFFYAPIVLCIARIWPISGTLNHIRHIPLTGPWSDSLKLAVFNFSERPLPTLLRFPLFMLPTAGLFKLLPDELIPVFLLPPFFLALLIGLLWSCHRLLVHDFFLHNQHFCQEHFETVIITVDHSDSSSYCKSCDRVSFSEPAVIHLTQ